MPTPMTAYPGGPLTGEAQLPGDKSISHRALILGSMASGKTTIFNLLEADDVLYTAAAVRAFGAEVEREGGRFEVTGTPWRSPERTIYCGNAGTGVRLLMGAAAGQGVTARFDGDISLRKRPMGRILDPLRDMGVLSESDSGLLPVTIVAGSPRAIHFELPKPSAQIKTAVLLATLGADGETVIEEPVLCRDHTERMLGSFGVDLAIENVGEGRVLRLAGRQPLKATQIMVPADPSSAAFPIIAATILEGSSVTLPKVMMNPTRIGFLSALKEMGAEIATLNEQETGGELVADLTVRSAKLRAMTITADLAPALIDEYPVLAVAAAFAEGTSRFEGLSELRVKESDRLSATADLLSANGVICRTGEDWIEIDGGKVAGGGLVTTHHDHRIAMSALVLGLAAQDPVSIDDADMIATSFPNFTDLMKTLGARIEENA